MVKGSSELLKGSVVTLVLRGLGMLMGYAWILTLSKVSGSDGVGFYQTMLQILNVGGMVLALGMNMSVLRYSGQFNNPIESPKLHSLCFHAFSVVGPTSLVFALILYVAADEITSWLGNTDEYATGLRLVALAMPLFTGNKLAVEFIRGMKHLHISELLRSVIRPAVMMLCLLTVGHMGMEHREILWFLLVGIVLNSAIAYRHVWRLLSGIPKRVSGFTKRELVRTSLPMMWTNVASALLLAMPVFFIGYWCSQSAVGIYSVAFQLAALISVLMLVLETVVAPKFTELFWARNFEELQAEVSKTTSLVFWSSLLASMGIVLVGKWILGLFGSEFISGFWVLVTLSIGNVVNASLGPVGILLNMTGKHKAVRNIISSVAILTGLAYFLFGATGNLVVFAAIFSAGKVINNMLAAFIAFKSHRIWTFVVPISSKGANR